MRKPVYFVPLVLLLVTALGCTGGTVIVSPGEGNRRPVDPAKPVDPSKPMDPVRPTVPRLTPVDYAEVQVKPVLEGGFDGLARTIHYPQVASKAGIEGDVRVSFVVNTGGGVEQASVVGGIGGGCDEEALRAIQVARFTPGRDGGMAVNVRTCIAVRFRLSEKSISARYCAL